LTVIDPKTLKVVASWPLKECEEPTGLAIDTAHHRLFSVCQSQKMIVTDSTNGHEVASVAIGKGPDAVAFDVDRHLIFSSNGEGTLTVVHEDDANHYHVVQNVDTQKSARTLALDAKTHRVYLAAAEFGTAPAPTAEQPHPRPPMVADSFTIVVVGPK
jgi:DNA-binding beta-propeller fold protein YncE